jgi:hypothetical protein
MMVDGDRRSSIDVEREVGSDDCCGRETGRRWLEEKVLRRHEESIEVNIKNGVAEGTVGQGHSV